MATGDERITVSRETLRAELAEMELRLTRWVASADSVKTLEGRVSNLEASRIAREHLATDVKELENTVRVLGDESIGRTAIKRFLLASVGVVAACNGIAAGLIVYLT